jgi:hypothetical protein
MYTTIRHELRHAKKAWPGTLVDPYLLSGRTLQAVKPNLKCLSLQAQFLLYIVFDSMPLFGVKLLYDYGLPSLCQCPPLQLQHEKNDVLLTQIKYGAGLPGENILSFAYGIVSKLQSSDWWLQPSDMAAEAAAVKQKP